MMSPIRATATLLLASALFGGCGTDGGDAETDDPGSTGLASTTTTAPTTANGPTGDASTSADDSTSTSADDTSEDGDTSGSSSSGEPARCSDTPPRGLTLESTATRTDSGWERVERWSSDNPGFVQEQYLPDPRSEQMPPRLGYFGSDPTPHSREVLLYAAPGWEQAAASGRTPVLLVHGANDNADRAWADPGESGDFGCGSQSCPDAGLMQALVEAGFPVFAVGMPHTQGDDHYWAEQIGNAIRIIRQQTCAEQVDLVGWSKGAFAARMYVSSVTEDWGTPYADDVRRLVLIGSPNLGFDYLFRYGTAHNAGVWPPTGTIHAPLPHETQMLGAVPVNLSEYAVWETAAGDFFRGQRQMVAMWVDEYPLTFVANNGLGSYAVADTLATYWGEGDYSGVFARGRGIQFTVEQGSLVEDIVEAGIPEDVPTYLLCSEIVSDAAYIPGIPNEIAGPSDGVVFVNSCAAPDGIGTLAETAVLEDVNHLQLGWAPPARQTVIQWLEN